MTQHLHPQTTLNKLNLKDLIIHILGESKSVLTLDEILIGLRRHKFPFEINKAKIRGLVNKLAKKEIVEYVYIDLSYSIRLVNHHNSIDQNVEVVS